MKNYPTVIIIIIFFFSVYISSAQNPNWINYTCGNEINRIVDHGNILWIATSRGLVKYDKLNGQSTYFNKANSGLPDNFILSIATDTTGILWIVTDGGLSRFDGIIWTTYTTANSGLPTDYIRDIVTDQTGTAWIASMAGLVSYDGANWITYDTTTSQISNQNISRSFISPAGEKWMITYAGLERFDGINWNLYNDTINFFDLNYTTDIGFKNNELWIATHGPFGQGYGVIIFDGVTWINYTPANSAMPLARVDCIDIDSTGNVWMSSAMESGKLVKYDGTGFTVYSNLINSPILNIFIDDDQHIYLGTASTGAYEFVNPALLKISTSNSGLNYNGVTYIYIDDHQDYWFTGQYGITGFDGQNWFALDTTNSSFLYDAISDVIHDHTGNTWIGTHAGLVKFDGTNWTRFDSSNSGLTDNFINCLMVDADNNIWVGTNSAPFKFDGTAWTNYFVNAGSHISQIFVTGDSDVWIGAPSYGLNRFDRVSTWQQYQPPLAGSFRSGTMDKNGNVWYGTGSNLYKWDGTSWSSFTTGLPSNFITALAVDTNNIIWIGTQQGLSAYDGNIFTDYMASNSPLTGDYITDISTDANNNKWICTSYGITVYNENGVVLSVAKPENKIEPTVTCYPNPAHDYIRVHNKNNYSQREQFIITDVLGSKVLDIPLTGNPGKIDISELKQGIYLYYINDSGNINSAQKLVVY